jgi:hypothetical protein
VISSASPPTVPVAAETCGADDVAIVPAIATSPLAAEACAVAAVAAAPATLTAPAAALVCAAAAVAPVPVIPEAGSGASIQHNPPTWSELLRFPLPLTRRCSQISAS